jgi:hypothetical protein
MGDLEPDGDRIGPLQLGLGVFQRGAPDLHRLRGGPAVVVEGVLFAALHLVRHRSVHHHELIRLVRRLLFAEHPHETETGGFQFAHFALQRGFLTLDREQGGSGAGGGILAAVEPAGQRRGDPGVNGNLFAEFFDVGLLLDAGRPQMSDRGDQDRERHHRAEDKEKELQQPEKEIHERKIEHGLATSSPYRLQEKLKNG